MNTQEDDIGGDDILYAGEANDHLVSGVGDDLLGRRGNHVRGHARSRKRRRSASRRCATGIGSGKHHWSRSREKSVPVVSLRGGIA